MKSSLLLKAYVVFAIKGNFCHKIHWNYIKIMSKVRIKPLQLGDDYLNATGGVMRSTRQIHFDKHLTDRSVKNHR